MMTLHNKYVYYFTVIAFFIALHTNAQTVTEEWVEFFDLTSNDVTVDDEGNFYITGWALQSGACTDYCTVKYNTYGDLEWSSYYTGTGDYEDVAHSIALDYNDNVIVTGISQDAFTSKDYLTVKYDNDGNEAWVRRYYYTLNDQWDRAYDVAVDEFGGVVVTGQSFSTAGYMGMGNDLCTIKYDASGDTSWISRYDLTIASFLSAESGNCIALDHNNNAVVAGWNTGTGDTVVYDLRTIKYGFSGGIAWDSFFSGPEIQTREEPNDIFIDWQDYIYVTGTTGYMFMATDRYDFLTLKYNSYGQEEWVRTYNGPGDSSDVAVSVAADNFGNVYVAGTSYSDSTLKDFCVIRYDSLGNEKWIKRIDGGRGYDDEMVDMVIDSDGFIYFTGTMDASPTGKDIYTAKYDSSGNEVWNISYSELVGNHEYANGITVNSSGEVFVSGHGINEGGIFIKYSQLTPVEPKDQIIQPHQFILHGNFPNPFNPTTTLTFTLPVASSVTLEVFDISGSRVGVGLAPTRVGFRQGVPSGGESDLQWYPPGIHAITFDGGDLPSGIYFARLLTEDFQQTQKLVLLK